MNCKQIDKQMGSDNCIKCDNCNRQVSRRCLEDQDDCNRSLYWTVCVECINTCYQCGRDTGYPKHRILTGFDCSLCDHRSCRSCGVNLKCNCCEQVACETCISDNEAGVICPTLKRKLDRLNIFLRKL